MRTETLLRLFEPKPSPLSLRLLATTAWLLIAVYAAIAWFRGASDAWLAIIVCCLIAYGMASGRFLYPSSHEGRGKFAFIVGHLVPIVAVGWMLFLKFFK